MCKNVKYNKSATGGLLVLSAVLLVTAYAIADYQTKQTGGNGIANKPIVSQKANNTKQESNKTNVKPQSFYFKTVYFFSALGIKFIPLRTFIINKSENGFGYASNINALQNSINGISVMLAIVLVIGFIILHFIKF